MYPRKKGHAKVYLAIILLAILVVASAAIVLYSNGNAQKKVTVGVHVGDTFTYSIKGYASLTGIDAVIPAGFDINNGTDYYKVNIIAINGTNVTMDTQWRFINGTEIDRTQTINLSNGDKTDTTALGFWALYASNLNVKDYLRPNGFDYQIVNKTDTYTYADSVRERNFFEVGNEFYDVNDPTHNTLRYDYTSVYFDKQTGMIETLNNIQNYNNPQMTLAITWKLTSSSVWNVK